MTEKIDKDAINALSKCYLDRGLKISVLTEDPILREESLRQVTLATTHQDTQNEIIITLFDEFRDADCQNPVLWLHLIMDTCTGFEESEGYDEWRLNEGFKNTAYFQSLYMEYARLVPVVRKIVGDEIKPLDSFHFELNTDTAKALRDIKI